MHHAPGLSGPLLQPAPPPVWGAAPGLRATASGRASRGQHVVAHAGEGLPSLPSLPFDVPTPTLPTISQSVWDDAFRTALESAVWWGVPAVAVGLVLGTITSNIGTKLARDAARDRRLRRTKVKTGGKGSGGLLGMLGGSGSGEDAEVGAPQEYLKIERINERYESYAFSLEKATVGTAPALAAARRRDLRHRFGEEVGDLTDEQLATIVRIEAEYKDAAKQAAREVEDAARELRLFAIGEGELEEAQADLQAESESKEGEEKTDKKGRPSPSPISLIFRKRDLEQKMEKAVKGSIKLEQDYLKAVSAALGPDSDENRLGLARLIHDRPFNWDPSVSPLELPSKMHAAGASSSSDAATPKEKPTWFVLEFFGDVQASQGANLREEVTAIVANAKPERGDGVVLVLNTGGGTVTGYGLAAAQLMRLKQAGLSLTICVEQVAASGGYMMACLADRLVSSPFAVLGSIGVLTDIPNVYDRLTKEGIMFQTITAGKFKRTITPTKKVTEEDIKKTTEDIEAIFKLFKGFVKESRPQLDIDLVATGETWFGQDALERKLVDELKTSDDIMLELVKSGAELYKVKYMPKTSSKLGELLSASAEEFAPQAAGGASDMSANNAAAAAWFAQGLYKLATGKELPVSPAAAAGAAADAFSTRPDQAYRAQDPSPDRYLL
eukprot:TRINITY_DN3739_c0_g1_i1.p1 TRINITY_DN3739_c0_g1~~TRINITY_DN3739_c0_g1_i1.p1  ORF type:complete len:669 (+),score=225.89 TRINITY_DN3739_c0_g1_i1:97-2103(+)